MSPIKRILNFLLAAVLMTGLVLSVCATEDETDPLHLTLTCVHNGQGVAGLPIQLYQIADLDEELHVQTREDFASFREDIESDNSDWEAVAAELAQYISSHGIAPLAETVLDDNGTGKFPNSGEALESGVYLVLCPDYRFAGAIYRFSPVIVSLPNFIGGALTYQITANMKFYTEADEPLDLFVTKRWNDAGREPDRPLEITVDLLQNGVPVEGEARVLNESNQWSGSWTGLDPLYRWTVQERPVPGYSDPVINRSEEETGIHFTIINTPTPKDTDPSDVPKTGQLQWPIPWLALGGMAMFLLGWCLCSERRKERG